MEFVIDGKWQKADGKWWSGFLKSAAGGVAGNSAAVGVWDMANLSFWGKWYQGDMDKDCPCGNSSSFFSGR